MDKIQVNQQKALTLTVQTNCLIASLIDGNEVALIEYASDLLPAGQPRFEDIRFYPSITQIVEKFGKRDIRKVITALIKNFCDSVRVNDDKKMNETQMVECACFLLDECGNFRIEDYVIMFSLAKRGKLNIGNTGRIFDRVDIQLISDFKANYEQLRVEEGYKIQERELRRIEFGENVPETGDSKKQIENFNKAMDILKKQLSDMGELRDQESQKRKDLYQQRKEELFTKIQALAEKNGYAGSLIDLSPFKKK